MRQSTTLILPTNNALIDDRLLVAHLVGEPVRLGRAALSTTTYWYYRACRAAVEGGVGQLSGPFAGLPAEHQATAIRAMLSLPGDITLPDPRVLVPEMVDVHQRHPHLRLMNLEAVAAATVLGARVLLSERAAAGVLPQVLDAEGISWRIVAIG